MGRSTPTTAFDGAIGYFADTLLTVNICMKEFGLEKIIFVSTDSTEIFFSKLRSAGLNYNIPNFFTDSYCAGVSNKHCLLTFFIVNVTQYRIG